MRPILSIILALIISILSITVETYLYVFSGISIFYSIYLLIFLEILSLILGGIIIAWSATDKKIRYSLIYGVIFAVIHGFVYNLLFKTSFVALFVLILFFAGIGGYLGTTLDKHLKTTIKTEI